MKIIRTIPLEISLEVFPENCSGFPLRISSRIPLQIDSEMPFSKISSEYSFGNRNYFVCFVNSSKKTQLRNSEFPKELSMNFRRNGRRIRKKNLKCAKQYTEGIVK